MEAAERFEVGVSSAIRCVQRLVRFVSPTCQANGEARWKHVQPSTRHFRALFTLTLSLPR